MAVSNNILVMALETFRILRIDLDHSLEVEGIDGERSVMSFTNKDDRD